MQIALLSTGGLRRKLSGGLGWETLALGLSCLVRGWVVGEERLLLIGILKHVNSWLIRLRLGLVCEGVLKHARGGGYLLVGLGCVRLLGVS